MAGDPQRDDFSPTDGSPFRPSALPPVRASIPEAKLVPSARDGDDLPQRTWLLIALGAFALLFVMGLLVLAGGAVMFALDRAPAPPQPRFVALPQPAPLAAPPTTPLSPVPEVVPPPLPVEPPTKPSPPAVPDKPATGPAPPEKPVPAPAAAPAPKDPPAKDPPGNARLRYAWAVGKRYHYTFTVEADLGSDKQLSNGSVIYSPRETQARPARPPVEEEATGSAFVVTADGYLVTCAHVVKGAKSIEAHLDGRKLPARVIGLAPQQDLAVLKVDATNLPVLPLGSSESVQLAEDVRVVGYPLTDVLGASVKVTRGTVAGLIDRDGAKLIQVDASINAGNSGGPLVSEHGEVVGVASAKLCGEEISNVGFAVPGEDVQTLLRRHRVNSRSATGGPKLEGPELAKRVTPSVALLRVKLGPDGFGAEKQFDLGFTTSLWTESRPKEPLSRGFGRPPRIPSPFDRSHVPQNEHGTLRVDAAGEIEEGEAELSLPFLLGPAALLCVEPFGEDGERSWRRQRAITIVSKQEDRSPFGLRRPPRIPDPFGRFGQEPKPAATPIAAALERFRYEIVEETDEVVVIKKTYALETLDKNAAKRMNVSGQGQFTFDRREGVPRGLEFELTFEVVQDEKKARIPVKLSYKPYVAPSTPPVVQTPGTPPAPPDNPPPAQPNPSAPARIGEDEVVRALAMLKSDKSFENQNGLQTLSRVPADARRAEVAKQIEPFASHTDMFVRMFAIQALRKWSTEASCPTLLTALEDKEFAVRHAAMEALAEHPRPEHAAAIVAIYTGQLNGHIAKGVLTKMGSVAEDAVLKLLDNENWVVRKDTCEMLRTIGTAKSLPVLTTVATKDGNGLVKMLADRAVKDITARAPAEPPATPATAPQPAAPQPAAPQPATTPPASTGTAEAETVLREFLVAMMLKDAEAGAKLIVAHPESGLLFTGTPPAAEQQAAMRERVRTAPVRALRVGETAQSVVLGATHVHADRQPFLFASNPVPFVLVREATGWKVDVAPLIAARKAK